MRVLSDHAAERQSVLSVSLSAGARTSDPAAGQGMEEAVMQREAVGEIRGMLYMFYAAGVV